MTETTPDGLTQFIDELTSSPLRLRKLMAEGTEPAAVTIRRMREDTVTRLLKATTRATPERPRTTHDWQDDALCAEVGTDLFFPSPKASADNALQLCAVCPVREACLEYALKTKQDEGIWGGTTPTQRKRLRRGAAA